MRREKISIGIIVMFMVQAMLCSVAFADSSVSASKDGITVTKKAEWTKYKGNTCDTNGNPYAKIKFTVDTSKAKTTQSIIKGGDTDIVVLLDNSVSMGYKENKDKFQTAKDAAVAFATDVLAIKEYPVRVGLVSFATDAVKQMDLGTDLNTFKEKVAPLKAAGGTNIQHAIWLAQNMLKTSDAHNKIIVLLSDGHANGKIKFEGEDIATTGANDDERAQNQLAIAQRLIPKLKVVGIGYDTLDKDEAALEKLTTKDASGKSLFYKASIGNDTLISNIKNVFEKISKMVNLYVVGNNLTDTIPAEFDLVEGSFESNVKNLDVKISNDKKTVKWMMGDYEFGKDIYTMSFIMTLDKTKTPKEYFTNKMDINSNGKTIDPSVDSLGSSILFYGAQDVIELKSPTLPLSEEVLEPKQEAKLEDKNIPDEKIDESPKTNDTFNAIAIIGLLISGSIVLFQRSKLVKN